MNTPEITLDNLFREAKAAMRKEVAKKKEGPAETPLSTWVNPDNWKHFRYLLLIHKETQKVLGIYSELLHIKQPGCRRLVTADALECKPDATEYVSGDWETKPESLASQHKHLSTILNLALFKLENVRALNVSVDLHFAYGKLAGVRLNQDTTFAKDDIIYAFPKGTDIFLLLSQASINAAQECYHGN